MVQEMDKKSLDNRKIEEINAVELETLQVQSKIMKFQSDAIINYIMRRLMLETGSF
jgi:hypothetical protein